MAGLLCPVCNASLASLAELNGHLDAKHSIADDEPAPKINDRTAFFVRTRKAKLDRTKVLRTKLELRLIKLLLGLQQFANTSEPGTQGGLLSALTGMASRPADRANQAAGGGSMLYAGGSYWNWQAGRAIKEFEQQIVVWEDESVFDRCRLCGQKFSLLLRKHHCRVCGLVMCGDWERECSLEVPANLLAEKMCDLYTEFPLLPAVSTAYPVRICSECRTTLLSLRNYRRDRESEPPRILTIQSQLLRIQREIEAILPSFEEQLATITKASVSATELAGLRRSRQKLLEAFGRYEALMRKMPATAASTDTERRLQTQIIAKAAGFLEATMVPLQTLPQALRYQDAPQVSKVDTSRLQSQLVVLEEQRFLLEQQANSAKRNRHFDVLAPLEISMGEIDAEIQRLNQQLGQNAPSH